MQTKFYVKTRGADKNAFGKCLQKAIEIAGLDSEIDCIVLYSYAKSNFCMLTEIFGESLIKRMFSFPVNMDPSPKPFLCATEKTYGNREYNNKDIVVCCHLNSQAVFKVDDYASAKYVIALSWTNDGLDEWINRWNAENICRKESAIESNSQTSRIAEIALQDMDISMFETKCLGHSDDIETCKTYIRAIHKYIPEFSPSELQNYLVVKLNWKNKDAVEVAELLQRLKEGRTFRGGEKTNLQVYYKRWKDKSLES